ncbi:MAG: MiaB-like tRNA modifying enzyme [Chlamydiales bacterium]|jgi:ribosomal protein S12 methylthiotransferase|nr:MiaB-like tRNA modifying enzyme [Chlamydiales bacterium]
MRPVQKKHHHPRSILSVKKQAKQNQVIKKAPKQQSSCFEVAGNKVYFISLGCPRNLVDSEVMLGILLKAGYEPGKTLEGSDYIIINTCGFLEASRDESLQSIQDSLKNKKKLAKVIVTGCMVRSHSAQIQEKFPEVDYLLGAGDVEKILAAVESQEKGSVISSAKSYLEAGEVPRQLSTPKHYAYLKIAEGCRKRCAYCIIPDIKGPLQSKSVERIVKEFQTLLDQGIKEIILIAQDLGDWGKDLGYRNTEGLIHVLKELLKIEGDYWLRLLYLYPDEITDELIELMKSDKRICSYLDMPIQHINNEMLKSMYRATSKEKIVDTLVKLRAAIPEITVRTSLIVGYPGETEAQFNELVDFVKTYKLDNVGVFKYSQEAGSKAAELPDQIADEVKQQRYEVLMKAQQEVVAQNNASQVGKTLEVVIENYHPETNLLMVARHRGQCPEIDSQIIINDASKVSAFGERYLVKITDVAGYDLIGAAIKKL